MTIAKELLITITDSNGQNQASAKMLSFDGAIPTTERIINETGFTGTEKPYNIFIDEIGHNPNIRIDCKLGHELKQIRQQKNMSLMDMSIALGITPSELSKVENKIGGLTDIKLAKQIMYFCHLIGYPLSDNPMVLSKETVNTDIGKGKALILSLLDRLKNGGA